MFAVLDTFGFGLSQLADGTTLFVRRKQDIACALNTVEHFGAASGLGFFLKGENKEKQRFGSRYRPRCAH